MASHKREGYKTHALGAALRWASSLARKMSARLLGRLAVEYVYLASYSV